MGKKNISITVRRIRRCTGIESVVATDTDTPSFASFHINYEFLTSGPFGLTDKPETSRMLNRVLASEYPTEKVAPDEPYVDLSPYRAEYDADRTKRVVEILTEAFPDFTFKAEADTSAKSEIIIPVFIYINVITQKSFQKVADKTSAGNEYTDPVRTETFAEIIQRQISFSDMIYSHEFSDIIFKELRKTGFPAVAENMVFLTEEADTATIQQVKSRIGSVESFYDKDLTESLADSLNSLQSSYIFITSDSPQKYSASVREFPKPGFFSRLFGKKQKEPELTFVAG